MTTYRVRLSKPLLGVRLRRPSHTAGVPAAESADAPGAAGAPTESDTGRTPAPPAAFGTAAASSTPDVHPLAQALEQLAMELLEMEAKRRQSLRELQAVAVELGICLAERLVHATIDQQAHSLPSLFQAALENCGEQRPLAIRFHPDDLAQLEGLRATPDGLGTYAAEGVELKADPRLARGSCEAELDDYRRRFDWPHQLQEIRQALLDELDHAQTERRATETSHPGIQRVPERRETA